MSGLTHAKSNADAFDCGQTILGLLKPLNLFKGSVMGKGRFAFGIVNKYGLRSFILCKSNYLLSFFS